MPDAYNPWGAPVFPTAADNAMQPETFVPQGVRDWTQQAAPKDYNILSQIAGSLGKALMYPGQVAQSKEPISTEDMVGPAFNLASMLTLGAGAAPQEANALNMGIKAYHGSPHDFDKFDLSKIGTGEGAQAYGHGLYFADNEGVAQSYRDALGMNNKRWTVDGDVVGQYGQNGTPLGGAAARLRQVMGEDGTVTPAHVEEAKTRLLKTAANNPGLIRDVPAQLKGMDSLVGRKVAEDGRGHMYEVNINADPSHFLDWDRPNSQQHPVVQDALKRLGLMKEEALAPAVDNPAVIKQLSDMGVPGAKYLDQGSRGAGEGSSNYVVFNHDLIDIMRKYAVPGMLGAPILANALSEQKT